jgi:hypothetical protein
VLIGGEDLDGGFRVLLGFFRDHPGEFF